MQKFKFFKKNRGYVISIWRKKGGFFKNFNERIAEYPIFDGKNVLSLKFFILPLESAFTKLSNGIIRSKNPGLRCKMM